MVYTSNTALAAVVIFLTHICSANARAGRTFYIRQEAERPEIDRTIHDVDIAPTTLDNIIAAGLLDKQCAMDANPDKTEFKEGDTVFVPLDCCEASGSCQPPFCDHRDACPIGPGHSQIPAPTGATTITGHVKKTDEPGVVPIVVPAPVQTTDPGTVAPPVFPVPDPDDPETPVKDPEDPVKDPDDPVKDPDDPVKDPDDPVKDPDDPVKDPDDPDDPEEPKKEPEEPKKEPEEPKKEPEEPKKEPDDPNPVPTPTPTPGPNPPLAPPKTCPLGKRQDNTNLQTPECEEEEEEEEEEGAGKPYLIHTVDGVSKIEFEAFLPAQADRKANYIQSVRNKYIAYQILNLSEKNAALIRLNPRIRFCEPIIEDDGAARAIPPHSIEDLEYLRSSTFSKRELPKFMNQRDGTNHEGDWHLGLLSARNQRSDPTKLPNYVFPPPALVRRNEGVNFENSLGQGQTIYILDTGYRSDHQEFDKSQREIREHCVPNSETLGSLGLTEAQMAPEDMTDHDGHGTMVASVAAGYTHGVASLANLVVVKFRNAAKNPLKPESDELKMRGVTDAALSSAFAWVLEDILDHKEKPDYNKNNKFIINMSYGFIIGQPQHKGKPEIMEQMLQIAKDLDVTVVVAAGNDGPFRTLDTIVPQNLGTDDRFSFITVGGVDKEGRYYKDTTNSRQGKSGKVDLYAGAVGVNAADAKGAKTDSSKTVDGTSAAAPAIAGLAAYFFSRPELASNWGESTSHQDVKAFMIKNSEVRNDNPFKEGDTFPEEGEEGGGSPKPDPKSLIVPYNLAINDLCELPAPSSKRWLLEKRVFDPNRSVPGRKIVEDGNVVDVDAKNAICNTHPFTPGQGPDEDPSQQDPGLQDPDKEDPGKEDPGNQDPGQQDPAPTEAYSIGASGGNWVTYSHPKGQEMGACGAGESISTPVEHPSLLSLEGEVKVGPFDLPNSYKGCSFSAKDAKKGGGKLECDGKPAIDCKNGDGAGAISTCLGDGDSYQEFWSCNN